MLKQFKIKDFKCYEDNNYFDFPGLTVLCGTNNSGKSSLLQSIYLMTQNRNTEVPTLSLNNINFKLGTFSDVLYKEKKNTESIEFSILFDNNILEKDNIEYLRVNLVFKNPAVLEKLSYIEGSPVLTSIEVEFQRKTENFKTLNFTLVDEKNSNLYKISGDIENGYTNIEGLIPESIILSELNSTKKHIASTEYEIISSYLKLINDKRIHYLKAYRAESYIRSNTPLKDILGICGEYTAEIIGRNWNLNTQYYDEKDNPVKFSSKFQEWIKQLLGKEYRLEFQKEVNDYKIIIEDTNRKLKFELFQVGFGISQLLPILALILMTRENDIILIENPEMHLHPRLQADLVDLFIFAMEANRKLIVETHSEHIVNRIRLRIKQNNRLKEKINIYFFEKEEVVRYQEIEVDSKGNIDYWPKDFFDQSYYDLLGLIEK